MNLKRRWSWNSRWRRRFKKVTKLRNEWRSNSFGKWIKSLCRQLMLHKLNRPVVWLWNLRIKIFYTSRKILNNWRRWHYHPNHPKFTRMAIHWTWLRISKSCQQHPNHRDGTSWQLNSVWYRRRIKAYTNSSLAVLMEFQELPWDSSTPSYSMECLCL